MIRSANSKGVFFFFGFEMGVVAVVQFCDESGRESRNDRVTRPRTLDQFRYFFSTSFPSFLIKAEPL